MLEKIYEIMVRRNEDWDEIAEEAKDRISWPGFVAVHVFRGMCIGWFGIGLTMWLLVVISSIKEKLNK